MYYQALYAEQLCVCLLFLTIQFVITSKQWKPRFINPLSCIYLLTITAIVLDMVWIFINGNRSLITAHNILQSVYLSCYVYICYCWFEYCASQLKFHIWKRRRQHLLLLLPPTLVSISIFMSPVTDWYFSVDSHGFYHRGPMYIYIYAVVCFTYIILGAVISVWCGTKAEKSSDKKHFYGQALGVLFPTMAAIGEIFLGTMLPIAQTGITVLLFVIFIVSQEYRLTRDKLTNLHNRFSIENILSEKINKYSRKKSSEAKLVLMVCDLDGFKLINDTYGHQEGDYALRLVSDILQTESERYGAYVGRIGGDEFCIILEIKQMKEAQQLKHNIKTRLQNVSLKLKYTLRISIGLSAFEKGNTYNQLLNNADTEMYEEKKRSHKVNDTTGEIKLNYKKIKKAT